MKLVIDPVSITTQTSTQEYELIPAFVVSSPAPPSRTERMLDNPQTLILGAIVVLLLILVLRRPSGSDKKGE